MRLGIPLIKQVVRERRKPLLWMAGVWLATQFIGYPFFDWMHSRRVGRDIAAHHLWIVAVADTLAVALPERKGIPPSNACGSIIYRRERIARTAPFGFLGLRMKEDEIANISIAGRDSPGPQAIHQLLQDGADAIVTARGGRRPDLAGIIAEGGLRQRRWFSFTNLGANVLRVALHVAAWTCQIGGIVVLVRGLLHHAALQRSGAECGFCLYDTTGIASEFCPECGRAIRRE